MFCTFCGQSIEPNIQFCTHCGTPVVGGQQPINQPPTEGEYKVASLGLRFLNSILDEIISWVIGVVLVLIFSILEQNALYIIALLSYRLVYYIVFESLWQRTPGKFITGTKVVLKDGTKAPLKNIVGRSFARLIPFNALSFLFGPPIGWHDTLSKTLVVPKDYTPEQVQRIDIANQKSGNKIFIVIIGVVVGIAVLGLLASVVLLSLNSARAKSRDAKRYADVTQMSAALELYRVDNDEYPELLSMLAPKYMVNIPQAPTPADGTCSSVTNTYEYSNPEPNYYELSFCIGGVTSNISQGEHIMTPDGMDKTRDSSPANTKSEEKLHEKEQKNTPPPAIHSWKTFTPTDSLFTVKLPTTPESSTETQESGSISVKTTIYISEVSNTIAYLVGVYQFTPVQTINNPDTVLKESLNGVVASHADNKLVSSKFGYFGAYRSLDFTITQGTIYLKGKLIVTKDTEYSLLHTYVAETYNQTDYDTFISSFKIR